MLLFEKLCFGAAAVSVVALVAALVMLAAVLKRRAHQSLTSRGLCFEQSRKAPKAPRE
jgi:hypothetical protein